MVLDFEFTFLTNKSDHRFGTLLHFFPQNLSNQMAGLMVNFSNTTMLDIGNLKKEKMDFEILFEKILMRIFYLTASHSAGTQMLSPKRTEF